MIYSKRLSQFNEIIHGFTTRDDGDFRLANFGQKLPIGKICPQGMQLVLMKQQHNSRIKFVKFSRRKDKIILLKGFDGLITFQKGILLGVRTADCLPILFYESVKKIVAVVHAGWRGTLGRVAQKMVEEIKKLGGSPENIVAVMGPHIGMCCYNIPKERVNLFTKVFGQDKRTISNFENGPHLDLAYVNFLQLLQVGVKKENIETPPSCTFCQKEQFFSFRRSKNEGDDYGEMLSYIGIT